jgi:hypothetical protein
MMPSTCTVKASKVYQAFYGEKLFSQYLVIVTREGQICASIEVCVLWLWYNRTIQYRATPELCVSAKTPVNKMITEINISHYCIFAVI